MAAPRRGVPTSAWMLDQQMRAEMEADAWRRLRFEVAAQEALALQAAATTETEQVHRGGSTTFKAIVRFMMGTFAAYLAYLAGVDSGLGEFEIWLAVGAGFVAMLALTAFGPFRSFVYLMSETARWAVILALIFGALWFVLNPPA